MASYCDLECCSYISRRLYMRNKLSAMASGIFDNGFGPSPKVDTDTIAQMLAVNPLALSVNADEYRTGHAGNDRGLRYQIEGRATRIEVNVGNALATYQDPIKAMFGTRICEGQKVQVVRKYVVGGKAVATPERAPARIVKVKEDAKEVELTRYGADLTMNLNLMLRPSEAKEELDMKVAAQKQSLENELTQFGYTELLKGLKLGDAIARSKGHRSATGPYNNFRDSIHKDMFAAFQRYENPLTSLIALAKTATAYRNVIGKDSLMILPTSTPEMLEYAKYNKLHYSVNGIKATEKKALNVAVEDVYDDPTIGLKLMVHHPPQDHSEGQNRPFRGSNNKTLFREVILEDRVYNFTGGPIDPDLEVMDTEQRKLVKVQAVFNSARQFPGRPFRGNVLSRRTRVIMGSAVIGVPGANTGELLVGYPFTATSTNQRTESMCVSLRVYLGAVLKQPENVVVLPNVFLDQVVSCEFFR